MIAAIKFKNLKVLRDTELKLGKFNLVIGSNGSGKSTLMDAGQRLRKLAKLPLLEARSGEGGAAGEVHFRFSGDMKALELVMLCEPDPAQDTLLVEKAPENDWRPDWERFRSRLQGARTYLFDHRAIARPAALSAGLELAEDGANLAAVLAHWEESHKETYESLREEFMRVMPEFDRMKLERIDGGQVKLLMGIRGEHGYIEASALSQGTLYLLAYLTLAYDPAPPVLICVDEMDRGIHPRLLPEIRDLLYRLSYPEDSGLEREAVQVIATTHSPYMVDLFKEHPEEVIIAEKKGGEAKFLRLDERGDLAELLQGGALGEMWFSGILGGVPEGW